MRHTRLMGLVLLGAVLSVVLLAGCTIYVSDSLVGNGVATTSTRTVDTFNEIELTGAARLEITIGALQPITLTGDENLLPLIKTEVASGKLTISSTEGYIAQTPLVIRIAVPDVTKLTLTGGGAVSLSGLQNSALSVLVIGAGELDLAGQTDQFTLSITGAGEVDALSLVAKAVNVSVTGAGDASVQASETLNVLIEGFGVVSYRGNPVVTPHISGLGSLEQLP
jgi:hypothetical protein